MAVQAFRKIADGRAFDRQISVEPDEAPRAIAATVSNLLAAIEDERIVAIGEAHHAELAARLTADIDRLEARTR